MPPQPYWLQASSLFRVQVQNQKLNKMARKFFARYRPVEETSTLKHTRNTSDRHPWPHRDSNPRSQRARGRRLTPWTAGHWYRRRRTYGN